MSASRLLEELRADLRYAWRSLQSHPGSTGVALAILGLAIGANVVLFAFIDTYALRPLPIAAADRYVEVLETDEQGERTSRWTREEMSVLEVAAAPVFEGLYGSRFFEMPMLEPTRRIVHGQAVSPSFFPLVGARMALGRAFGPEADRAAGGEAVAVLSHSGWKRLLNGDVDALGRKLRLASSWFTVVGVAAPEFRGVETVTPELWIPLAAHASLTSSGPPRYGLAGILKPGMTPERATALGSGVVAGFERRSDSTKPRRLYVARRPSLLHSGGRSELSGIGALVLAAFGLVLLIACANLASLHVARACARHREIATRLALGATRARLVRQLLTESLLLALVAALIGFALAMAGAEAIQAALFAVVTEAGLTLVPIEVQGRVLAFALFLGTMAGLAFGLLPALEATSSDLTATGRRDGLVLGGRIRPQRLGSLLVTAQVTASLVLLVLASLMLRNAQAASAFNAGYDIGHLIDLRFPRAAPEVLERLRKDTRVVGASAVSRIPLSGQWPRHSILVDGTTRSLRYNYVDETYFDTLGVRLVHGRTFLRDEAAQAAPVVVVSAATARSLWATGSPIGRTLEVPVKGRGPAPGRYEVIGVAPDLVSGIFFEGLDPSAVYFPAAGPPRATEILIRPRGEAASFVAALRDFCQEVDPAALCEPKTVRELAAFQRFPFLAASIVASSLGTLALVLTSIGLYGIVAFAVVQRFREIGVRMALGSTPMEVLRLMVGRAARSVLIGFAVGLPVCVVLAWGASRLFRTLNSFDPVVLLCVPLLLAVVTVVAALIPARRATLVSPWLSLRAD